MPERLRRTTAAAWLPGTSTTAMDSDRSAEERAENYLGQPPDV